MNGINTCAICKKDFILSDPKTFEFDNDKSICKDCFLIVFNKTSWSANREIKTIFEYVKVRIPHKLKWKIWERDNFECKICLSKENLSIDHITPESLGGTLDENNLQTLCKKCNSKKSNKI